MDKTLDKFLKGLEEGSETVLVAYSGGKDSTYVLKLLHDYGVDCVAYLVDNSFVPPRTLTNAHSVCDRLNVRLVIDRLPKKQIRGAFRKAEEGDLFNEQQIRRASDICNVCMHHINQNIVRFALGAGFKYLSGGYVEGQVPKTGFLGKIHVGLYAETMRAMETQLRGKPGHPFVWHEEFLYTLSPLLAIDLTEQELVEEIESLGWRRPESTGLNSSNCLINDYAIRRHLEKHGVHPYRQEIEAQLRRGLIEPAEAERKLQGDYSSIEAPWDGDEARE